MNIHARNMKCLAGREQATPHENENTNVPLLAQGKDGKNSILSFIT